MKALRYLFIIFSFIVLVTSPKLAQTTSPPQQAAQHRFAKLDNLRLHYENYGGGKEAIVFIHGWTCNAEFWRDNVPAFNTETRVLAVDLPGHGQSDKPKDIAYSMDLFARSVNAVLLHAKVERATLVGHSMGAPVIRQFYRLYPEKTRALVIVDGGLKPLGTPASFKQFIDPMRGPDYLKAVGNSVEFLTNGMLDANKRAAVKTAMLSAPQHVMVSAMEEMLNPSVWQDEVKFNVPMLAVMAHNPQQWNSAYEQYVRSIAPTLDYQTWPNVSHFLMMDKPRQFNGVVMTFLKRNKIIR